MDMVSHASSSGTVESCTQLTPERRNIWSTGRQKFLDTYDPAPPSQGDVHTRVQRRLFALHPSLPIVADASSVAGQGEFESYKALSRVLKRYTSSRVKTYESLKGKVNKEIKALMDKEENFHMDDTAIYRKLDEKIKDRAGVSILVYFPDDVSKVAKAIKESSFLEDKGAAISFTKSRADHREEDSKGQKQGKALDYSLGGFMSQSSVSTETIINNRWRHSGYRAAHIHVRLKSKLSREWDKGYIRSVDPRDLKAEYSDIHFKDLEPKLAEIQITTVSMHACAQVEHDIFYKMSTEMLPTATINRMLDGVNGLSITTEIMLEELERNMNYSNEGMERNDGQPFENARELQDSLTCAYLNDMNELDWKSTPEWSEPVLFLTAKLWKKNHTRASFRDYIRRQDFFNIPRTSDPLDISVLILETLSIAHAWNKQSHISKCFFSKENLISCSELSQLLHVANSFSLMVGIEESLAVEKFRQRFSDDGVRMLRDINAIFLDLDFINSDKHELVKFADRYLAGGWCEVHDVAVALSRLGFINSWYEEEEINVSQSYRDLSDSKFRNEYGDVQAVIFPRTHSKSFDFELKKEGRLDNQSSVPRVMKSFKSKKWKIYGENDGNFQVATSELVPIITREADYLDSESIHEYLHQVFTGFGPKGKFPYKAFEHPSKAVIKQETAYFRHNRF